MNENQNTPVSGSNMPQMTPVGDDQVRRKTSGLAIASLIFSILGFVTCGVTGIVGFILGIISLVQISRAPAKQTDSGMAIAGLITGVISLVISLFIMPIMAAIMFPVFAKARESARATHCMENVTRIDTAMQMYTNDWDGYFPPASGWNEAISSFDIDQTILKCPSEKNPGPSYAMNKLLSNSSISNVVSLLDTVLVFESVPGVNINGGIELLPKEPRHGDFDIMGFADGHVSKVTPAEVDSLSWDPTGKKQPVQKLPSDAVQ